MSTASTFGATSRPPKTPRPWPVPRVPGPTSAEVVARWASAEVTPWIDHWSASEADLAPGAPVASTESRMRCTFVVESPGAEQVLLWANRLSDETDLSTTLMDRVPGTGLWAAAFVMPTDWRASYCFLPRAGGETAPWLGTGDQVQLRAALDRGARDLRNPTTCRNRAGVLQSVVEGPEAPRLWPDVSGEQTPPGWRRRSVSVAGRGVAVVEPVDALPATPVLVVLDGEVWDQLHHLPAVVADFVGRGRVCAQRIVLVPSGGRVERWSSLAGDPQAHLAWLADVVAEVAPEVPGLLGPAGVTLLGQSLGGVTALRGVLERGDVFGWALSQSASTWLPGVADVAPQGRVAGGVHLAHGAQEWVLAPGHADLVPRLRAADVLVETSVHQGGHDYAWWRHAVVEALLWQEDVRSTA
ncbi:alpha/beta hydrolase [Nocardioides yefusunii]|uniref:Alpha/beta hydrolase n=1 Tax=Nocardioides yefusunii TaxID=2500546 RepID=A0ABW1R1T2_9ACTN|nr:enterochelin esterase domain-containing protein [Nocardioides yefusunii]